MTVLWRQIGLLALLFGCLSAAIALPKVSTWGLVDRSSLLPEARGKVLLDKLSVLAQEAGIELAVVVERGEPLDETPEEGAVERADDDDSDPAPTPTIAAQVLAAWQAASPAGADAPAAAETMRAVVHLPLAGEPSIAATPALTQRWSVEDQAADLSGVLLPAVATGDPGEVAAAAIAVCQRVEDAAGSDALTASDDRWSAAANSLLAPPFLHPWMSPWLLVVLPTLLFASLIGWRDGPRQGCLALPLLLLLYSGLYLLIRFRPEVFAWLGGVAVLPLLVVAMAPPRQVQATPASRPTRRATSDWPGAGGFGVTGFGGLGTD